MDEHYSLLACVTVALVNLVVSVSVSAVVNMRSNDLSFMDNAREVYSSNKELLLTSTLIVLLTTYLAVEYRPSIEHTFQEFPELSELPGLSVLNSMLPGRRNSVLPRRLVKNLAMLH
jgi:hypothetical protein